MLPPLQLGDVLRGRYKVLAYIGQGGMGLIYQAEDLRLRGRLCALKEVQGDPTLTPETQDQAREQFYREASVLARLDHPNLPKVSDFFSVDTRDYLVMDFVPGRDLRDIMNEARQNGRFLPEPEVVGWALQLADALTYLHSQEPPIVHRDIKPSNLKLTPDGRLKLVDFGLVKVLAPDERTVTVIQGVGTAYYTPLEQYGGDTGFTDARTDIYSFGATFYHLLCNEPPAEAKQRFLRTEALKPLRSLRPDLNPNLAQAMAWAMALHPDDRPPDVATLREAMHAGTVGIAPHPSLAEPNDLGNWLPTSTERWLALIAASLLGLALILTWLAQSAP